MRLDRCIWIEIGGEDWEGRYSIFLEKGHYLQREGKL